MAHYIDELIVEGRLRSKSQVTDLLTIASANQTSQLLVGDPSFVVVTGSTLGQVVRLPNATTLIAGRHFQIFNQATVPVALQDNSGTVLAYLSALTKARVVIYGISTAAGVWVVEYDPFGYDKYYNAAAGPFTNASNTDYVTTATFTTGQIPAGDYRFEFSALWTPAANNRGADFRLMDDATPLEAVSTFTGPTGGTSGYQIYTNFIRATIPAGSHTIAFQFRNNGAVGNTTITVINARLSMYRLT